MTEQQKKQTLVKLARFIIARMLELATGKAITLHWIDLDTGLVMFRVDPNDDQVKYLLSAIGGGAQ